MLRPPYRAAMVAASQNALDNNIYENLAAPESYISPSVAMYLHMTHRERHRLSNHGHFVGASHLEPADMTTNPLFRTRVDHGNVSGLVHMGLVGGISHRTGSGTSDSSHLYQVASNFPPYTARTAGSASDRFIVRERRDCLGSKSGCDCKSKSLARPRVTWRSTCGDATSAFDSVKWACAVVIVRTCRH
jgi:hypothetical protein